MVRGYSDCDRGRDRHGAHSLKPRMRARAHGDGTAVPPLSPPQKSIFRSRGSKVRMGRACPASTSSVLALRALHLTPATAGAFTGSYRGTPSWRKANAQRRPLPPLLWRLSWRLLAARRHGEHGLVRTQPGPHAALAAAGATPGEPTMVAARVLGAARLATGAGPSGVHVWL
jgi:hypothetical protein